MSDDFHVRLNIETGSPSPITTQLPGRCQRQNDASISSSDHPEEEDDPVASVFFGLFWGFFIQYFAHASCFSAASCFAFRHYQAGLERQSFLRDTNMHADIKAILSESWIYVICRYVSIELFKNSLRLQTFSIFLALIRTFGCWLLCDQRHFSQLVYKQRNGNGFSFKKNCISNEITSNSHLNIYISKKKKGVIKADLPS